jgi:hypothetical protein
VIGRKWVRATARGRQRTELSAASSRRLGSRQLAGNAFSGLLHKGHAWLAEGTRVTTAREGNGSSFCGTGGCPFATCAVTVRQAIFKLSVCPVYSSVSLRCLSNSDYLLNLPQTLRISEGLLHVLVFYISEGLM